MAPKDVGKYVVLVDDLAHAVDGKDSIRGSGKNIMQRRHSNHPPTCKTIMLSEIMQENRVREELFLILAFTAVPLRSRKKA